MDRTRFSRQSLSFGDEEISVLVATSAGRPKAVFLSYDAFLEIAAALYTAIEALRAAGIDPDDLAPPDEPGAVIRQQQAETPDEPARHRGAHSL